VREIILAERCECPTSFDVSKFKLATREGEAAFHKAWDQLCAETPSEESTCSRIRQNQELYLEFQQKCLNQYDPTLQQAIEHAGDIIRELTKCARYACDRGYIEEKITRLRKKLDDLHEEHKI
jgi:hypothetical protein